MGALAMRHDIDMTNTKIDVKIQPAEGAPARFGRIDVTVKMPKLFEPKDRTRLERAADACPIKHSFLEDILVSVSFQYPE